jgi:hypothetical protein
VFRGNVHGCSRGLGDRRTKQKFEETRSMLRKKSHLNLSQKNTDEDVCENPLTDIHLFVDKIVVVRADSRGTAVT